MRGSINWNGRNARALSIHSVPVRPLDFNALTARGIYIQPQDIPGLYRINGGPELTYGQVLREVARMVREKLDAAK